MAATIDIIGKNGIKHSAVYEESSVRKFELMKEDYVRLVFSTDKKFAVSLGDYITLEDWGTFYITKPKKPTYNLTTGGYDYDLQFDAPHYRWNNKLYKFEPNTNRNEASWSLTDNLQNHMAVFLRNLEHHGWNYTVDTNSYQLEAANRYIYIQFDNCYLLDALTKIAEAFGVEWWITDNIIHFGKAENGSIVDFEVGVNVQEMGSENSNKEYFTRIYAFGSTQNIPSGYRKNDEQLLLNGVVQKRVMLPASTPYVDIEDGLADEEIVEGIVIFDDVYPRLDNSITDLRSDEREVKKTDTVEAGDGESSDESETETVTIYRFKDSSLTFSKDYILPGVQLQVQFQSGKLNGMIFDLAFNPDDVSDETPDGQWFEIVRNDTYGVMLPNGILKPAKTDRFVLLGWDVTKLESGLGLITAAENEVLARANDYAEKLQTDSNTYPCHMMSDYMFGLNNRGQQDSNFTKVRQFPLGQRIRLNNSNFFVGGSRVSRVVGYEYKLDKPYDDAVIYVGESATYSSKQAQEAKINEAMDAINYRGGEYTSSGGGGSNIYIITSNENTTPTDGNVFSALKTERRFARKDADDNIGSLWTFNNGHGARRGIQTHEYNGSGANEDNLFGHGFELITKTDGNGNQKSRLEIDELFVRIKAFFASLEIREISYLGGNYAFSSAGSKIYHVEWLDGLGNVLPKLAGNISSVATFRCYLYSDDGTTATMNKWEADDQIMCQTFNIDEGVHANTSNKYFWRRCTGIGKGEITDDDTNTEYQYVDISMSDCAINSDYPEDEDTIVQFGNWTNSARQGLIYLKVEGADAPAIIEYSGVGANGQHFVLPDPTLQLSPNRNIIYGEFHSIVNGSVDKVGDGDTIDDQLRALIDALNDIKSQADQKFDIWFGVGVPLPNTDNPNATANYPASDWPTDALKALHAQDIFYDTDREPAADGGRAWRWIAYELNGVVHYRWDEITDADTLASLEQISDVASDGKLTGGAEKTRVFVDWQQAVDYYWQYKVRSEDQRVLTEWTAYHNAFVALGTLLNGGNTLTKDNNGAWKTPSWLIDLSTTTEITNAQDYRDVWNAYYAALATLIQKVSKVAQDEIDNLADDDILTPFEKLTVLREWDAITTEKADLLSKAATAHVSTSDYVLRYNVLGNYLNDPVASDQRDITTPFSGTPAALLTDGNTTIRGTQFKTNWSQFYNERTKLLSAISTSKASYFVSVNVPTPPYHVGDIWMRLANSSDTQGKMYICVVDNETSTGRLADWADMSEITRDPFVILSKVANEAWEFMGGYIRERGYINIFVARTAPSGTIGDIFYNATNNTLYQYASDGWESISRATLLNLGASLYQIMGIHTFRVYSSTVANPNKYDMCVRNITFTDPLSGQTIQGNLNILAYTDGNWITLQDSTKAMIENYANQLNSYMFGSENGYIKASGMVTKTNITELFAVVNDPDSGDIVTKAYLQVYTDDFVDANGVRQIISGVRISADKIDLTGTDSISLGINGIKSGLANTGINIEEGKITLNAETTTINGNLNLYDNRNNGITVYDEYNISRVNIQSDAIGDIAQMANDTYTYESAFSQISTTSFNNTVTTPSIGSLAVNKTIEVDNITIMTYGSNSYPSTYSASLKIEILNGSTVVATKSVTIIRQNDSRTYRASTGFRYTVKTSGTYYVRYTISGITETASSSPVYLSVNARIQTSEVVQTLIGADGFYSHTGANKFLWLNENELQFRFGFCGLRLYLPNENSVYGILETIAGVHGSDPNYKPTWLPFHNVMPVAMVKNYEQRTIVNIGETKYCYKINPQTFRGILILDGPAYDSNFNKVETWIELPDTSFSQDGVVCPLPIGYTITIIKNFTGANLFVVPNSNSKNGAIIIDANLNNNYYVGMNSNNETRETFVYVGGYAPYSSETWISFRDH